MGAPVHEFQQSTKAKAMCHLMQESLKLSKRPACKNKRGLRSIELLRMIDQQLVLLFGSKLDIFGSKCKWFKNGGFPSITMSSANPRVITGARPSVLSLVTDQGADIGLCTQQCQCLGLRFVNFYDSNHRDDNDSVACAPPLLKICYRNANQVRNWTLQNGRLAPLDNGKHSETEG